MSLRCLWDADTDNYAEDVFMNVRPYVLLVSLEGVSSQKLTFFSPSFLLSQDSLFCAVTVLGIYFY